MDNREAKILLQSCRPKSGDSVLPAFAEAVALAERDPELKSWWEAEQVFDQKISAKLAEVPLPPDLRERILAGHKIQRFPQPARLPSWLAIAALFIIVCVAGLSIRSVWPGAHVSTARYDQTALTFLNNDSPPLATLSDDHEKLMSWLRQQHSPVGTVPVKMAAMPGIGCQTFAVQGHTVSLICFAMADGQVVHLFIVEKQALTIPPGTSPEFQRNGNWSTASWSDDSKSYMLATQANVDKLKELL